MSDTSWRWMAAFLPSSGGWFLLWFCLLTLFGAPYIVLRDGATARHVSTGLYIIEHRSVPDCNYVWAIDPTAPWVTHEILGDIALGFSYLTSGLNGVALVGITVLGLSLMWAYQMARLRGLGRVTGWLFFAPVLLATSLHWHARSHIFSYLFMLISYYIGFMSTASVFQRATASFVTMMVWANFHGSVPIGLLILAAGPLSGLTQALWRGTAKDSRGELGKELLVPAAAALGCVVNLRGGEFYSYIIHYFLNPVIMGVASEWRSLNFTLGIGIWSFLAVFAFLVTLWLLSPKRPPLAEAFLVLILFFASLHAMRFIPYFALLALLAMGQPWQALRNSLVSINPTSRWQRIAKAIAEFDWAPEPPPGLLIRQAVRTAVLFLTMCIVFLLKPEFKVKDYPQDCLPVRAADFMQAKGLNGLCFVLDNWGPYLYHRLARPLFIDDKTDFYPRSFVREYNQVLEASPGYEAILDKYRVQHVLVPPARPLAEALSHSPGWYQSFADSRAVLFSRNPEFKISR